MALRDERRRQPRVVDVRAGPAEQVAVEHEDAHRASLAARPGRAFGAPVGRSDRVLRVSASQRYRLRNPASGREIVLEAEPGEIYLDRESGEELEVVGKVLPLAPSSSRLPWAVREPALLQLVRPARAEGPQRLPDLRPAHGAAGIAGGRALRLRAVVLTLALLLAGGTLAACGGGSSAVDSVPKSTPNITPPNDTSAEKAAAQTTSTSSKTSTSKTDDERKRGQLIGRQRSHRRTRKRRQLERRRRRRSDPLRRRLRRKSKESEKSAAESSPSGGAGAPTGK